MTRQKWKRTAAGARGNRLGAYQAGLAAGKKVAANPMEHGNWKIFANAEWMRWWLRSRRRGIPFWTAMRRFQSGFAKGRGAKASDLLFLPTARSVAAIVTAMNEEKTLSGVLAELARLPLAETIVVVNGSNDGTFAAARKFPETTVVHYSNPLGYDVGRAIGAKVAQSDILLFLDGDFIVEAKRLIPFIRAIGRGADAALNNISPYIGTFANRDAVTRVKEFMNRSLRRPDLGPNSLTAVPHALSRKAVEKIGVANLSVPPKAHAMILLNGLNVRLPCSIDVLTRNKHRQLNVGEGNPVAELIVGDYLEALSWAFQSRGTRLSFPDMLRKRFALTGG
ncbi:MAG TPA: glycosyltransferase [Bacilli bacterium]